MPTRHVYMSCHPSPVAGSTSLWLTIRRHCLALRSLCLTLKTFLLPPIPFIPFFLASESTSLHNPLSGPHTPLVSAQILLVSPHNPLAGSQSPLDGSQESS